MMNRSQEGTECFVGISVNSTRARLEEPIGRLHRFLTGTRLERHSRSRKKKP